MRHPTLLVSIDGCRPDGIQQADTPTIDRLIATGASTMTARTVMPSVTLPCHTSMTRGVDVARHGITTNQFMPLARPVPSIFDVAHKHDLKVGFFFNWAELRDLAEPQSFDIAYSLNGSPKGSDEIIAVAAALHIERNDFDLVFAYFSYVDSSGHEFGWMAPGYLDAISAADRCVETILKAYESKGQTPNVVLLSDHGGHERSHGTEMPEDMTIPWIANGPAFKQGHKIEKQVRIFDTAPTLAKILGIPEAREWDGSPIEEIFA